MKPKSNTVQVLLQVSDGGYVAHLENFCGSLCIEDNGDIDKIREAIKNWFEPDAFPSECLVWVILSERTELCDPVPWTYYEVIESSTHDLSAEVTDG